MTAEQFLATTPEGRYPELDAARRQQRSSRETLSILREAAERARREHADAAAALRRATVALDEATGAGGAGRGGVGACSTTCCSIRPEAEPTPTARAATSSRPGSSELTDRLAHIEQDLPGAVRASTPARSRCCSTPSATRRRPRWCPPSGPAQLADEFVALQGQVDAARAGPRGPGPRHRQRAGRGSRRPAPSWPRPRRPWPSPTCRPRTSPSWRRPTRPCSRPSRSRPGACAAAAPSASTRRPPPQQAILDRVGFPTWSAYVMGAGLLGIDPIAEERLERARIDLEAAESHWAQVAADIEADPDAPGPARPARGRLPRGLRPARRRRRAGRPGGRAARRAGAQGRGQPGRAGRRAGLPARAGRPEPRAERPVSTG